MLFFTLNDFSQQSRTFNPSERELPSKFLEQYAFDTRPEKEEHIWINSMGKSTHEEHLSQSKHANDKHFRITGSFLADSIGMFNVTSKNIKFYLTKSIQDDDFGCCYNTSRSLGT